MSQTIAQLVGADASTGFTFTSNVILASTNSLERFRVDSSGNFLIGTSSSVTIAGLSGSLLQIETANINPNLSLNFSSIRHAGTNSVTGATLYLGRSRGTSAGSVTSVADGDTLGYVIFGGANGSNFSNVAAWITGQVDGTVSGGGANDMPGRLVFSTTADGASSPTERARITNAGDLLIGTTTTTANGGKLQVSNGITFPATQVACTNPNTLDDYEEGTWTPNQGAGLTVVGPFSSVGRYRRIGNLVHVTGIVEGDTSISVTAGGIISTNLPFSVDVAAFSGGGNATNWQVNQTAGLFFQNLNVHATSALTASVGIIFGGTYIVV
jgi:hypothetical protein